MPRLPYFNIHHILFRAYFGLLAWVIFLLIRPGFDTGYYMNVADDAASIRGKANRIADAFGVSGDSVATVVFRKDNTVSWKDVKNKTQLSGWAASGDFINGWEVLVTEKRALNAGQIQDLSALYESRGFLKLLYDNSGRLRDLQIRPFERNRFFLNQPDPVLAAARFSELAGLDFTDWSADGTVQSGSDLFRVTSFQPVLMAKTPAGLTARLSLEPSSQLLNDPEGARTASGYQIARFTAGNPVPPAEAANIFSASVLAVLLTYFTLIVFVFWAFIRRITKGAIDWARGLAVVAVIGLIYFFWRIEFWNDVMLPLSETGDLSPYIVTELLNGLFFGGVAAAGYLAWESMAREAGAAQLELVDGFWRGHFFYKETGRAMLDGYFAAGIYLCLHGLAIFGFREIAIVQDSQFGHGDMMKLGITAGPILNALFFGLVTSTFQWGVGVQLFENLKVQGWIRHLLTLTFLTLAASVAGRVVLSGGPFWKDLLISGLITPFVYLLYLRTGMVTLITMLGASFAGYQMLPYLDSSNSALFTRGLMALSVSLIPFFVAIAAYRFGGLVQKERRYRPKYMDDLEKQVRIENEIQIAAASQYTLLPQTMPVIEGASIHGFFIPSTEVGGDFFDYVPKSFDDGTTGVAFVIADVSGKAMKAALQAIFTSGLILSRIKTDPPARLLTQINGHVFERTDAKTFVTALVGNYQPATRQLVLSSAGHCLPILKRDGLSRFLDMPQPRFPLGFRPAVSYVEFSMTLQPGDFLFFYSDGFPEAINDKGETFGFESLLTFVNEMDTSKPLDSLCAELKSKLKNLSGFKLTDDTTLVCLSINQTNQ